MRKRGFTLIELLVVVAIIALLIAILLPSLGRAKADAVRVQCASVLRQWAAVITMYGQENNDWIFARTWAPSPSPNAPGGAYAIGQWYWDDGVNSPYLNEWNSKYVTQLRTCPADAAAVGSGEVSYAMARWLPVVGDVMSWRLTTFNHPSTTALMLDSPVEPNPDAMAASWQPWFSSSGDAIFNDPVTGQEGLTLQARHMGIGNVSFVDGHVEAHSWADMQANLPSSTVSTGSEQIFEGGAYNSSGVYDAPPNQRGKKWITISQ